MANEKWLIVASDLAERVWGIGIYLHGLRSGKTLLKEVTEKYRDAVLREICKSPTVDAVEVVRCKDCKHRVVSATGYRWCNVWQNIQTMGDDGYCCFGERREGE